MNRDLTEDIRSNDFFVHFGQHVRNCMLPCLLRNNEVFLGRFTATSSESLKQDFNFMLFLIPERHCPIRHLDHLTLTVRKVRDKHLSPGIEGGNYSCSQSLQGLRVTRTIVVQ